MYVFFGGCMKCLSFLIPVVLACTLFSSENGYAYDDCCFSMPVAGEVGIAYDSFRGPAEGTWNGNAGGVIGANLGVAVWNGFGAQFGGSYGVYDWNGRGPLGSRSNGTVQQQGFLTGGVFYKTPCESGFQGGAVVDWMFNKKFGVFGLDPSFGQARFQAGYLFCGSDEVGVLGTVNLDTSHKSAFHIPVSFRAIGQVSLFYRHLFQNCSEAMVWAGVPYRKSLMFSGKRAGKFLLGASFRAPLTSCLSVEGHGVYMAPQGNRYSHKFQNDSVNVSIGLTYSFGAGSCDCCELWRARPYMPVANNSNFLVDTSLND